MKTNLSSARIMRLAFAVVAALLMVACASVGRPEGGARDETPPVYVRSTPAMGERNVSRNKIDVVFDENIQLDDAFNKVIVSPAQTLSPTIRSQGKHVSVELRDTLKANTTYTIDFADAIKDLNEGNVLDGFAVDFSTGEDIDSLRISGIVLEARTLEPAQGVTVGVYSEMTAGFRTYCPHKHLRTIHHPQPQARKIPCVRSQRPQSRQQVGPQRRYSIPRLGGIADRRNYSG
jgi:hypothetical protein